MTQQVIIVEMGYGGVSRFGFHTDETFHEVNHDVREGYDYFQGDFTKLMEDIYATLNVANPADFPVLVIERDSFNTWRRVTEAEILMGVHKAPWMYVMWTSLILAYGNNKDDLGTAMVSHLENGDVHEAPVIGGWPYDYPYAAPPDYEYDYSSDENVDIYFYEPAPLERRADEVFWTQVRCPYSDRKDLLNNIILSGQGWEERLSSEEDILAFENRLDIQRLQYDYFASVNRPSYPRRYCVWKACQKICNDGILLDWELAFTQALFQEKGADEIRRWVF